MDRDTRIACIVDLQREVSRALHGGSPEALHSLDLTVAQLRILYLLGREETAAVGQVAERLGVSQPSATRTLNRLVCHGLVERFENPADRRMSLHRLAPAGQGLLDQLQQGRRARLEAALQLLDPPALAKIEDAFRVLASALHEMPATAASQLPTQSDLTQHDEGDEGERVAATGASLPKQSSLVEGHA